MDKACQQFTDDESLCFSRAEEHLPRVVVHFAVQPGMTMSWRVETDTELLVQGARVWLTRAASPYDHWLQIGETFRLQRGERVWVSADGDSVARISLTTHPVRSRRLMVRLLEWCASLGVDIFAPRAR
nr:DUF2917 domain-containing protein [Paraburkholderia sp. C35]